MDYTSVAHLIDKDSFTWKVEMVKGLFNEEEVKRILAIPLSNCAQSDELVWWGDNTGSYTTKSGYK